jgi:hypothetical protein
LFVHLLPADDLNKMQMHRRGPAAARKYMVRGLPNGPSPEFGGCRLRLEADATLEISACAAESWFRSATRRTVERTLRSSRQHISFPRANAVADETRFSLGFPQSQTDLSTTRKLFDPILSELKLSAPSTAAIKKNYDTPHSNTARWFAVTVVT